MKLSRREALHGMMAMGAMAGLTRASWGQSQTGDPVWQAFEAAKRDHPEALGLSTQPSAGRAGQARLIEGRWPEDVQGVLFRNGPGCFDRDHWRYRHWFDGDGFIQRWQVGPQGVEHKGVFVQTQKWQEEEAAGRFLRPSFGSLPPGDLGLGSTTDMNVANTSVMMAGSQLWALWEGGAPWALDPHTLSTQGEVNLGEGLGGVPFSAHPKIDPKTGDIWNFGQDPMGARLILWRLGADGAVKSVRILEGVPAGMIHDFMITERYLVFIIGGPWMSDLRLPFLESFAGDQSRPMRAIRVDKNDLSDRKDWDLPPGCVFHFGGAWEEGDGAIVCDAALYKDAGFVLGGAYDLMRGDFSGARNSHSCLTRIELRPQGRVDLSAYEDCAFEFPQIDPRCVGQKRRYSWGVAQIDLDRALSGGLARRDLETGALALLDMGAERIMEEPLFIPKGAGEGEGYLIATALNTKTQVSELHLFDAQALGQGPIAISALDYATSLGFHGTWQDS
ncbi:carotenoid oxygenase family protein [Woodsholea maritima]|uniref:carotenoid oxygenase family protein n=1 Tax=Woodsholea maritima TaxID=240237 RepID=UPI0003793C30|nr:carotenoid oxygenase family protein [Woodsholea maritima]